ncbi:Uncharacterised protein [Dermatophilus congolensis]|uniref:Uncharacterized protein n=1 Tax=Dermatophilus congolensis TaxID=1863 RepID=A0AA46H106_9MICO|nr:Uncharacterised protein [Dermatophilus congolensis]
MRGLQVSRCGWCGCCFSRLRKAPFWLRKRQLPRMRADITMTSKNIASSGIWQKLLNVVENSSSQLRHAFASRVVMPAMWWPLMWDYHFFSGPSITLVSFQKASKPFHVNGSRNIKTCDTGHPHSNGRSGGQLAWPRRSRAYGMTAAPPLTSVPRTLRGLTTPKPAEPLSWLDGHLECQLHPYPGSELSP